MVVALLVVGPERLPQLAGQAGKWIGKARRVLEGIRSDIESEIKASELKEILEKQRGEIGELKEILKGTQLELEKDFDQERDGGDRELVKAVEKHIESTKQRELSLSSEAKKHEAD